MSLLTLVGGPLLELRGGFVGGTGTPVLVVDAHTTSGFTAGPPGPATGGRPPGALHPIYDASFQGSRIVSRDNAGASGRSIHRAPGGGEGLAPPEEGGQSGRRPTGARYWPTTGARGPSWRWPGGGRGN